MRNDNKPKNDTFNCIQYLLTFRAEKFTSIHIFMTNINWTRQREAHRNDNNYSYQVLSKLIQHYHIGLSSFTKLKLLILKTI